MKIVFIDEPYEGPFFRTTCAMCGIRIGTEKEGAWWIDENTGDYCEDCKSWVEDELD